MYPRAPSTGNYMTQAVVSFMLIGLDLYQLAMISFLYFTKSQRVPAILIGFMFIITNAVGLYLVVFYFKRIKKRDNMDVKEDEIDLSWFSDAYLHPGLKCQSDVFDESAIEFSPYQERGASAARSRSATSMSGVSVGSINSFSTSSSSSPSGGVRSSSRQSNSSASGDDASSKLNTPGREQYGAVRDD